MKIKFTATYDGHNTKRDGVVNLVFKAPLTEMPDAISSVRLVDKQFKVAVVVEGQKVKVAKLASFCGLNVDRHGEVKVKLETDVASMLCSFDDVRNLVDKSMDVYCVIGKEDK